MIALVVVEHCQLIQNAEYCLNIVNKFKNLYGLIMSTYLKFKAGRNLRTDDKYMSSVTSLLEDTFSLKKTRVNKETLSSCQTNITHPLYKNKLLF